MELNKENEKELIVSLITDNLRNTLLVEGLNKLGLEAGAYRLNLTASIFQLIGFEEDDFEEEVFERYSILIERIVSDEVFEDSERLRAISINIYESLIADRELQRKQNKTL
jgi:hypothetical protein